MPKIVKRILFTILLIVVFIFVAILILRLTNRDNISFKYTDYQIITITSDAFENEHLMPIQYTGRGDDISPNIKLSEISENAKSIAIIMDDIDNPLFGVYTHWVIWNIPVQNEIPASIPRGVYVESLNDAVQGVGYGKNGYKGPMPPFGTHRYQFNVYVLDCELNLGSNSGKKELIQSMDGHVLQYGYIIGKFK